ncbi:MAG: hypothetical protein E7575_07020 [Ruminococcaceae bacterium]|nr:hypothetical protein [Oscillospiraceae bacterium]
MPESYLILYNFTKNNFSYWIMGLGKPNADKISVYFFAAIALIYCLTIAVTVLCCVSVAKYKFQALLLLIGIPILIAPLTIVNPIGPR